MFTLFQLIAAMLVLTAVFAWLNARILGLPTHIGVLVMGLCASLVLIAVELVFSRTGLFDAVVQTIQQIDFYETVMHGMLAFLLFAGALQVEMDRFKRRAPVIGVLATIGVAISTLIMAAGFWSVTSLLGIPTSFAWALVFGALIAPTDPVAVLSTIKSHDVPEALETDLSGEALFNDGVGVVLFTVLLLAATQTQGQFDTAHAVELLVLEAFGGAALGLVTGYVAYRALRVLDDYSIEVLISLALATGTYALAESLHMSGPIAVVVAGVLIANRGVTHAMSDQTQRYMFGFWALVDDILNAILFLLIGLEVLVIGFKLNFIWIGLAVVPLSLFARFIAVGGPIMLFSRWQAFAPGTIPVLAWGGVHGGISIALALSLPAGAERPLILAATYAVVLFTLLVQGMSLGSVVRRTAEYQDLFSDRSKTAPRSSKSRRFD